jgi:hypothetical protein
LSVPTAKQTRIAACYSLAGLAIQVRCDDPTVAALLDERLGALRMGARPTGAGDAGEADDGIDVTIEIRGPGADPNWPERPAGVRRAIYDAPSGSIDYVEEVDELYVFYERRVVLRCTPAAGQIDLAIVGTGLDDAVMATHPLLTIGLLETLKRFGRFPLHAGALVRHDRGILLPGSSGAGKSTTTVALVRAGFGFLADDTVFLTAEPLESSGICVHGFPDQIDVTEHTAAMFPELVHLVSQPLPAGRDKHGFRVEDAFGVRPVARCRAAALVFPRIIGGRKSFIEPLSQAAALRELVPNVLLTDPLAVQAHLDMLGRLVSTVPSYVLAAGSNLDDAVGCVSELAEPAA